MFRALKASLRLLLGFARRAEQDSELDDEIRFHIEKATERNTARGMSPTDARRAAVVAFGGATQAAESARDEQRSAWLDDFLRDLRYGAAALRRNRVFAATSVITIALALAAASTVFSFVNAIYVKPLPVPEGARLVSIYGADHPQYDQQLGFPAYLRLRARTRTLDAVAAHYSVAPLWVVAGHDARERVGAVVSGNYFSLLGLRPALGRFFNDDEDRVPDRDAVVVIGYGYWRDAFHGDPHVLGERITINGRLFTIIGVAPPEFHGLADSWNELWMPAMMLHTGYRWCDAFEARCPITDIVARLAPGATLRQARAELSALGPMLREATNPGDSIRTIVMERASGAPHQRQQQYAKFAMLLSGIATLLLIVACANLSGLLLARGVARRREIALRFSLGAGRGRIARQLLAESLLLGASGAVAGALLSVWTSRLLIGFFTIDDEGYFHPYDVTPDWRLLAFIAAAGLLVSALFGVLPALSVSRVNVVDALKTGSGGRGGSLSARARSRVVAAQVAVAVVLLMAAVLLTRSFDRVMGMTSVDPRRVGIMRLRPRLVGYAPEKAQQYLRRAMRTIADVPGVIAVAPVSGSLVHQRTAQVQAVLPGALPQRDPRDATTDYFDIGPGYFRALGVPLLSGREFTPADSASMPAVALVNEALAKRLWGRVDVVGRQVQLRDRSFAVVGVVADYRTHAAGEPPPPTAYLSFWQNVFEQQIDARVIVRVQADVNQVLNDARRALSEVDGSVPVTELLSMHAQRQASFTEVRLGRSILLCSAMIALLLSMVGLFGVVSFVVTLRKREIGVRLAVGALPREVLAMIVWQGLRPIWAGCIAGAAIGLAGAPMLGKWLFGVPPLDMTTPVLAVASALAGALVATYAPARGAAKVEPAAVLRD